MKRFGRRTFSPEMVAEAAANPGGWVYEIVGSYGVDDAVPPESIRGAWKVDANGELTGEFEPNPGFDRDALPPAASPPRTRGPR